MSAAAGVLGVELEKCGHYRLGPGRALTDRSGHHAGGAASLAYDLSCNDCHVIDYDHDVKNRRAESVHSQA